MEVQNRILVNALCEILGQCNIRRYYIVYLDSDVSSDFSTAAEVNGNNTQSSSADTTAIHNSSSLHPNASDPLRFHEDLKVHCFQCLDEVDKYYLENVSLLKAQYGVLLFLYSVIISKVRGKFFSHKY